MQTYNGNEQFRTAAFPGAYITPADASRQIVKWTSDNEDIATVDFAGVVTAGGGRRQCNNYTQQQQMEAV